MAIYIYILAFVHGFTLANKGANMLPEGDHEDANIQMRKSGEHLNASIRSAAAPRRRDRRHDGVEPESTQFLLNTNIS